MNVCLCLSGLQGFRALTQGFQASAARACPGAAECSNWQLGPAPEPQNGRNGRSGLPRSRRMLDIAAGLSRNRIEMAARACPGAAGVPSVLEACLGCEGPEMAARKMASSGRLLSAATSARLNLASCMDMHGSALVYYIYVL